MTATGTGWEWQDGTLYRRRPRRWVASAVLHGGEGLALLLLPALFLVPSVRALTAASWSWSVEACVVLSRDGVASCAPAWVLFGIGGAILVGWCVALVAVVRMTIAQTREIETPFHLDARLLHVSTPPSLLRGRSPISVRWVDVVAIELPVRGTQTLLLRLVPSAEVVQRNRIERKKPIVGPGSSVTIECGNAISDALVLRHLISDVARWSLSTEDGAGRALRVAGV